VEDLDVIKHNIRVVEEWMGIFLKKKSPAAGPREAVTDCNATATVLLCWGGGIGEAFL
jgi:hypothetical protein